MSEILTQKDKRLSGKETMILKLLGDEKLSPWELARKSPIGMLETQAIVGFLIREELITTTQADVTKFIQITKHGSDFLDQLT